MHRTSYDGYGTIDLQNILKFEGKILFRLNLAPYLSHLNSKCKKTVFFILKKQWVVNNMAKYCSTSFFTWILICFLNDRFYWSNFKSWTLLTCLRWQCVASRERETGWIPRRPRAAPPKSGLSSERGRMSSRGPTRLRVATIQVPTTTHPRLIETRRRLNVMTRVENLKLVRCHKNYL